MGRDSLKVKTYKLFNISKKSALITYIEMKEGVLNDPSRNQCGLIFLKIQSSMIWKYHKKHIA